LVLIPAIWVGVVVFALMMARLAARSDDARGAAIAEHVATLEPSERQRTTTDGAVKQHRFDRRREARGDPLGDGDEALERDGARVRIK
jgi:hypothetical protein